MGRLKLKKFELPDKLLNELYELTGSPDAYKGYIVVFSDDKGKPIIMTRCDSEVTTFGLRSALETFREC